MKLNLDPVYCTKCGHLLIWTLAGTRVFCPKCKVWTVVKPKAQHIEAQAATNNNF